MHTTTTTLKQSIMPSLKHPNCGKISGYNGTSMTTASLLLETFMAVYGRIDHRDTEYGLRAPELSIDKQYMKYYFLLPRGAVIQSVKTFGYKPVKVTGGPNGAENTFVVSQHGDENKYYSKHGIDENLGDLAGRNVCVYYISMPVDVYKQNDFFPYVIRWKESEHQNAPEYNSCLCFYNILEKQGNMSNFAAKYLTYLAQECIGCHKVVTPATTSFENDTFTLKNPVLEKFIYEKADRTEVFSRVNGANKRTGEYTFRDYDHLMLPSVRFHKDVLYVMSMDDFTTLGTYTKYLAASLNHFVEMFDASEKHKQDRGARPFGIGNKFYTIDYQEGMGVKPLNTEFDTEKVPLIMVGAKMKGNPAQSVDNEIYLYCKSSTFNRMIFGPVPIWHARANTTPVTYSSYGNGCLSKNFIDQAYSEIDATLWRDLTMTDFKDSVFSMIVGYTSNEIDDKLFADSKQMRSMAANNSSYADALIYNYSSVASIKHSDYDQIRDGIASVYKMVFKEFIEFLHSASNLDQFTNPPDMPAGHSYEPFVRINQTPHKIYSPVMIAATKTNLGNETHDVHTVKLSYMIATSQHSNTNYYFIVEGNVRVKTHNRVDGGIYMATENGGTVSTADEIAILSSPFGKAARDAYCVADMIGNHVDFFIPSVIVSTKAIPATKVGSQQNRQVGIVEVSHRYPENIEGAKLNPRYYQQKKTINNNYEENSDIFSAIPPSSYKDRSVAVNGSNKETFGPSDVFNAKRSWERYVCSMEFVKNLINHTKSFVALPRSSEQDDQEYAFSMNYQIACLMTNGSSSMYDFMQSHEVIEDVQNFSVSVNDFNAIESLGTGESVITTIRNALNNESNTYKHVGIINTIMSRQVLSEFYKKTFPTIYTNFCANCPSAYLTHRLNVITKAVRWYQSINHNTNRTHLALINAALLMCNFGDKETAVRTSYYKREQYMAMSASAYLKKNPRKNEVTTLAKVAEYAKIGLNQNEEAKKISANPVFANIANVPMMKHTGKTYIHLLNDMCSVNSISMYYFIKCLCDFKGENFRFDFITGFVKRDGEVKSQPAGPKSNEHDSLDNRLLHDKIVGKYKEKGEETSFKDLATFMKTVNGALARAELGKHRAATDYILTRFAHDRSFVSSIPPSPEPRYQNTVDNHIESVHAEYRTFYQRGGRTTKEALVEREKNRIEEYLSGSA